MNENLRQIRDDAKRLADLLDDAENASGPWLLIPCVAERLLNALSEQIKPIDRCKKCNDTGTIETGNNDLPCTCKKGDDALFHCSELPGEAIPGSFVKRYF